MYGISAFLQYVEWRRIKDSNSQWHYKEIKLSSQARKYRLIKMISEPFWRDSFSIFYSCCLRHLTGVWRWKQSSIHFDCQKQTQHHPYLLKFFPLSSTGRQKRHKKPKHVWGFVVIFALCFMAMWKSGITSSLFQICSSALKSLINRWPLDFIQF